MGAPLATPGALPAAAGPLLSRPRDLREAAKQFEALLIQQLLKSAREEGTGWLGAAEDAGSSTAADLAQEQFAQALAQSGGLGLGARIAASLSRPGEPPAPSKTPALRGVTGLGR